MIIVEDDFYRLTIAKELINEEIFDKYKNE